MGIGTLDVSSREKPRRPRGSSGSSDGGDRRNPGGGSRGGGFPPFFVMENSNQRVRIVTWFILLAVMMTFVGLIAAYVVVSTNGVVEWNPFSLPRQVWVSTALLLLSSGSYSVAHSLRKRGRQDSARAWLLVTTVLGATFIASQILTWLALYSGGLYMKSNPYAGFFYFITFIHALHVVGGICALGYAVLRTWQPTEVAEELERRLVVSGAVGQYWHFMDALWVVLVLMFGFWK